MPGRRPFRTLLATVLGEMLRPVYGGIGCILCFHRVLRSGPGAALADNRALEVTLADLRWVLEWVRQRGLEAVALDEIPARLSAPRRPKFVAFTFDDGYRDNAELALPLFREFGIPFAIHIAPAFCDRTATPWWYALERALTAGPTLRFAWHERLWDFATDTLLQRETAFAKLAHLVRAQPRSQRDALVTRLCAAGSVDPLMCTRELIMDWDELRAVAADPLVTIGAHSTAHHSLNRLTAEEVRDELLDAKHQLEARLGRQIQHLAYPFGGRNAIGPREFALAAQCGFLTAMTTLSANLFRGHARHLHALPRLVVSGNYPVQRLAWMDSGLIPAKTFHGRRIVAG